MGRYSSIRKLIQSIGQAYLMSEPLILKLGLNVFACACGLPLNENACPWDENDSRPVRLGIEKGDV